MNSFIKKRKESKPVNAIENSEVDGLTGRMNESVFALLNNMPAIVFAINSNGEFVFWNKQCEVVSGYNTDEIVGNKDALKLLYPDTEVRKRVKSKLNDIGISLFKWENSITTKKGEVKTISWTTFNDCPKLEGWNAVALGYDITSQKNSERLYKNSQRKLEALAQTAIDLVGLPITDSIFHFVGTRLEMYVPGVHFAILSFDNEKNALNIEGVYGMNMKNWAKILDLLGWNPVGRRFLITESIFENYSSGKLRRIEKSLYEFAEGNLSAIAARTVEKFLDLKEMLVIGLLNDSQYYGGICIFVGNNNKEFDYSLVEGIVNQASVALYRRELENQLVEAKEKAEESDRLKSAFLANMSHEIRTPMNAIVGFSQLIGIPDLAPEKRKQFVEIINSKGTILVKLINDIIDASKIDSGQLNVVFAPANINSLLKNILRFYKKEKVFQKKESIEIKLTIPDGTNSLNIVTDEGRLEQVLTNLINNALKFTEQGSVEFGYNVDDSMLTFFVKDTGIGIEPRMQTQIFERFRQVDEGMSKKLGGTGLGLSISKGIVCALGGSVWVESELGSGTTFYFTIPKRVLPKEDLDKEIQAIEGQELQPNWKNKVILIAEDEEVNYIFLNELLESTGVNLLWAKDGAQAVDLVGKIKKIDLVLMDIKMPVMNGYAATMEIRQINPKIPIVAQTAYAFSEDRQKAEAAGCNDYITKPINDKELFGILERYLGV